MHYKNNLKSNIKSNIKNNIKSNIKSKVKIKIKSKIKSKVKSKVKIKSDENKTIPQLKKEIQIIVNEYIRLRDNGKRCVSCNMTTKTLQAGHFWSIKGYDGLRFDERNIHGECPRCNGFDDMHLIFYRENLIKRIGKKAYDDLFNDAMEYKRTKESFTKPELIELKAYFIAKRDKLRKEVYGEV